MRRCWPAAARSRSSRARLVLAALGQVAAQPLIALFGRKRLRVGAGLAVAARRPRALAHLRHKPLLVELLGPALDLVEVRAQRGELLGHVLVGAEVGHGEAAGSP